VSFFGVASFIIPAMISLAFSLALDLPSPSPFEVPDRGLPPVVLPGLELPGELLSARML